MSSKADGAEILDAFDSSVHGLINATEIDGYILGINGRKVNGFHVEYTPSTLTGIAFRLLVYDDLTDTWQEFSEVALDTGVVTAIQPLTLANAAVSAYISWERFEEGGARPQKVHFFAGVIKLAATAAGTVGTASLRIGANVGYNA